MAEFGMAPSQNDPLEFPEAMPPLSHATRLIGVKAAGMLLHDYVAIDEPGFTARPLHSILGGNVSHMRRRPDDEAVRYLQSFGVGERFAQEAYFERRGQAERWLWLEARKRYGLELKSGPPLYFRWSTSFVPTSEETGRTIGIPAASLPANQLTFTLYDSFHNDAADLGMPYENTPANLKPAVLTWIEIEEKLRLGQLHHLTPSQYDPHAYIECQFWEPNHRLIEILREGERFPWPESPDGGAL